MMIDCAYARDVRARAGLFYAGSCTCAGEGNGCFCRDVCINNQRSHRVDVLSGCAVLGIACACEECQENRQRVMTMGLNRGRRRITKELTSR